jgi:hypothetical protein
MIKGGRWANEHKHAAVAILDKQTFYLDVPHTYRGIEDVDMVPNLSPRNLVSVEIGKDVMLSHGYIKNDFDVQKWAVPEFLEQAAGDCRGAGCGRADRVAGSTLRGTRPVAQAKPSRFRSGCLAMPQGEELRIQQLFTLNNTS